MREPEHWNIRTRLNKHQLKELEDHYFATRDEFRDNVMRRLELNGATVVGNVARGFGNQAAFDFTGPDELMNEMQALYASMEVIHVLMSGGEPITPDQVTVTETTEH